MKVAESEANWHEKGFKYEYQMLSHGSISEVPKCLSKRVK